VPVTDIPATATLDDVASAAGVSTATVSRFFNSPDVVATATAERIRAAVERLGYIPNLLAGGLASNRSGLVAVLIPELSGSIFTDIIESMVGELSASGYVALLGLTGLPNERTSEIVRAALARRVEAIIITSVIDEATRQLLTRAQTTVIEVWDLPEQPIDVAIGFSHEAIGRDLARFLRNRGHERPFLVSANGSRAQLRREGFLREWAAEGGSLPPELVVNSPGRFGDAGRCVDAICELDERPDAVVCTSDLLAQGVIIAAQAAGLRVPLDLAVIGFGNTQLADEMRPSITSVDIDGARIAREAVGILHRRAGKLPVGERRIDVGFRIIPRETA
jgi:LacI family transcriptional regulator, gluconate utilization system Gnt-I transcriptional repressor